MSKVRSKDTKPELMVRSLAHRLGYRFRLHYKNLPGTPDIVFPRLGKIINVNGCFWHNHNCPNGVLPKSNVKFWTEKIANNKKRDKLNKLKLNKMGWMVMTVWECQLRREVAVSKRLKKFLEK